MKKIIFKIKNRLTQEGKPTRLGAFLIALLLIVIVFPDVIFGRGTLSMLDMANITWKNRQASSYHPERPANAVHYGYSDTGGAAFQSEPMIQFMKYNIDTRQSPYWNPYSATGAVGPETLIDNKFSPLTVFVALLGGSSVAFHFVLLSLYVFALYFIIRLVTIHLNLTWIAGITAAVVYLLNGYSTANISSNVAQSYLYFPILLFALCSFAAKPNYWRFVAAVFANTLLLATTFLPTTTLVLMTCYLLAFAFTFNEYRSWKTRLTIIGLQIFTGLAAFLTLAFLWLPILESAKTLKLFEMYGTRHFYEANIRALLLFFTPKHFWEAYNATPDQVWQFINNVIFHFGIVTSLIVAQVISQKKNFKNWIIVVCLILLVLFLGRIFAIPGLFQLFGYLPQLKNIGGQYLWIVVAIVFTILSAYGMDSLSAKKFKIPAVLVYIILFCAVAYLWIFFLPNAGQYIVNALSVAYKVLISFNLGVLLVIVLISIVLLLHLAYNPKKLLLWKTLFLLLIFFELFYYLNTMRYKREDIFQNPPQYIQFIKDNIGDKRLVSYTWNFNPELGAAYQIPQLETQNYNFPWYQQFYEHNFMTAHDRWTNFLMVFGQKDEPNIHEDILDFLSVKYILTDRTMSKYVDYFILHNYPLVFDDSKRLIFENTDVAEKVTVSPVISGQAKITSYKNTEVTIEANLNEPGTVILNDNWSPNWQVTANNQKVTIEKVNESFRGLSLATGNYTIKMTYAPKTLRLGKYLALFTALILVILLLFRKKIDNILASFVKSKLIENAPAELNEKVSFAVVLPMFNEESNVKTCVSSIDAYLKKLPQKTAIIAVDDGSSDQTLIELKKAQKKMPRLIIENHKKNLGYGAANITGAKVAYKKHFDYVLFMDADLTQDPKYIGGFVMEMKKGTDYIKATRYNLGGRVEGVPFKRRIISQVGNLLAKMLFRMPLTDYTNGFRAAKASILSQIKCHDRGFSYLIEEVRQVSKLAKTYAEVSYVLTVRTDGSKSKFRYNIRVYFNYLKYLFKK